ncbi:MAG: hypothetical protein AAGA77_23425 [Bacteroidota bacterium]
MHSSEYVTGKVKVHSHKFGEKVIHHQHKVLEKVEKATAKLQKTDGKQQPQQVQVFTFDQLKLFSQELSGFHSNEGKERTYYSYLIKSNQSSDNLSTPPPK